MATPAEKTARRGRRRWKRRLLALFALAVVAAVAVYVRTDGTFRFDRESEAGDPADSVDRYHRVGRGGFEVTVLLDGTLDAIKRHELAANARTPFGLPMTVTYCVEENESVKAGDKVMEFASEKYQEKVDELVQNLDDNEKERDIKTDDLSMRRSQNLANLKASVDALHNHEDALERYVVMDVPRTRKDHQEKVNAAKKDVKKAEGDLADARTKRRDETSSDAATLAKLDTAVDTAVSTLAAKNMALADVQHRQRVWKRYEHPQKLRSLHQNVAQGRLNLARVTVESRNGIFQIQRNLHWLNTRRRNFRNDLANYRSDLEKLVLFAPVDGIVNLGNINRPHWEQPKEFKIGTQVNHKEIVASIPDLSRFLVKCQIPEEHRSRVQLGLPGRFRSPAIPDLVMHGKLTEISPIANNIVRWDPSSPKVYDARMSTDSHDKRLMPGMSVKIEIVVETIADVLFVPVEAVYNREGVKYVRVRGGAGGVEREVQTGRSSLSYVEILSGLDEGEEVLLFGLSLPETK